MHFLITCFVWILYTVSAIPTIRSSTKCSVEYCANSSLFNCVSNEKTCYKYQTKDGQSVCAPASPCELLDPCDNNQLCSSSTSICIINSCCAQPVCLPLILVDLCSSKNVTKDKKMDVYTTATRSSITSDSPTTEIPFQQTTSKIMESSSSSIQRKSSSYTLQPKICPKAYWDNTGILVASFPNLIPKDFFINQYDQIYIPDSNNHIIRKYFPGNDSTWITAAGPDLLHDPTTIFVDGNDNIYILDAKTYRVYSWKSETNQSRTILSFDGCKKSIDSNQICFGISLFVDQYDSLYITESSNKYLHANRVMKFEANSTIGRVIAGSSTYGSGIKQLNSPQKIFVDSKEILYVTDIGNSRIQKFVQGNRNGVTVMSVKNLNDFIIDEDGHFYVLIKSENIIKKVSNNNINMNIIQNLNQPTRLHFGNDGSIYVLGQENIQKFQIMNNIC